MKTNKQQAGITLLEAIVVIAAILLLVSILLPALAPAPKHKYRISCYGNLMQIGTAYRVWASDNRDRFPAAVSIAEGGWRELLTNRNAGPYCWTNYVAMQNEFGQNPRTLICPLDLRKPATNFSSLGNANLSYFVGVTASQSDPQSILAGDRNLGPGSKANSDCGFSPANNTGNDVIIQTNAPYRWSFKMHSAKGNLLFADGSVQSVKNARFGFAYQAEDTTNNPANLPPPEPEFRLIFP